MRNRVDRGKPGGVGGELGQHGGVGVGLLDMAGVVEDIEEGVGGGAAEHQPDGLRWVVGSEFRVVGGDGVVAVVVEAFSPNGDNHATVIVEAGDVEAAAPAGVADLDYADSLCSGFGEVIAGYDLGGEGVGVATVLLLEESLPEFDDEGVLTGFCEVAMVVVVGDAAPVVPAQQPAALGSDG